MTKIQLMHEAARISGVDYQTVQIAVKALEFAAWRAAKSGEEVTLMTGVKLLPVWVPERVKIYFGEPRIIPGHYRIKSKITHHARWQKQVNVEDEYTKPDKEEDEDDYFEDEIY